MRIYVGAEPSNICNMCVCESERERERVCIHTHVYVRMQPLALISQIHANVCVRERGRQRTGARESRYKYDMKGPQSIPRQSKSCPFQVYVARFRFVCVCV